MSDEIKIEVTPQITEEIWNGMAREAGADSYQTFQMKSIEEGGFELNRIIYKDGNIHHQIEFKISAAEKLQLYQALEQNLGILHTRTGNWYLSPLASAMVTDYMKDKPIQKAIVETLLAYVMRFSDAPVTWRIRAMAWLARGL